ncbi:hypothetical protein [Carboxydocella sp. JDF658]|uniref:hypothetical protein n=1 Tax=Carboxydocella sp. JDF658 TaxID=1926600 RepID=UPI0009AC887D|nr:hypothetical protein [Carboxydocella sp. JDF658]GAW32940.1 hypothetical protein JDF658_27050 [Carboxydocella sp. JDF658]
MAKNGIIHYQYLFSRDEAEIVNLWQQLSNRQIGTESPPAWADLVNENELNLLKEIVIPAGRALLFEFETITIVVQWLEGSPAQLLPEVVTSPEDADYLLGQTTLVVAPAEELDLPRPLLQETATTVTKYGLLRHNYANRQHHYYHLLPVADRPLEPLTLRDLPLLDLGFFRLNQELRLFKDQRKMITQDKREIDRRLASILHKQKQLEQQSEKEKSLFWEETLQELAQLYGTLGSNALVLKNIEATLQLDINRQSKILLRLTKESAGPKALLTDVLPEFSNQLKDFHNTSQQLQLSLQNAKAAIDVVQTQVELIHANETVLLQKEGLSLQVAAAFIEFIVVIYYSLSIWKTLTPETTFHHIPALLKLAVVVGFASAAVAVTHFSAEKFQGHSAARSKLRISLALLVALFGLMLFLSAIY